MYNIRFQYSAFDSCLTFLLSKCETIVSEVQLNAMDMTHTETILGLYFELCNNKNHFIRPMLRIFFNLFPGFIVPLIQEIFESRIFLSVEPEKVTGVHNVRCFFSNFKTFLPNDISCKLCSFCGYRATCHLFRTQNLSKI